jgi:hypothetical protein
MDWLSEVLSFLSSIFIGWLLAMLFFGIVRGYRESNKDKTIRRVVSEKVEEQIQNVIRLHVRSFNNCFYAYDAETEEFYAQGATLDEMVINLRENTKRSQAVFVSSDEEARQHVIDFLKSKLGKNPTAVGVNNDA